MLYSPKSNKNSTVKIFDENGKTFVNHLQNLKLALTTKEITKYTLTSKGCGFYWKIISLGQCTMVHFRKILSIFIISNCTKFNKPHLFLAFIKMRPLFKSVLYWHMYVIQECGWNNADTVYWYLIFMSLNYRNFRDAVLPLFNDCFVAMAKVVTGKFFSEAVILKVHSQLCDKFFDYF